MEGYAKVRALFSCFVFPSLRRSYSLLPSLTPTHTSSSTLTDGDRTTQYPDRAFKVPTLEGWLVVVNGPKLVDDMRKASEEYISFTRSISGVRTSFTPPPLLLKS